MAKPVKYGAWTEEMLCGAVHAVTEEKMSVSAAAKCFCVPRATLQRHLATKNKYAVGGEKKTFWQTNRLVTGTTA